MLSILNVDRNRLTEIPREVIISVYVNVSENANDVMYIRLSEFWFHYLNIRILESIFKYLNDYSDIQILESLFKCAGSTFVRLNEDIHFNFVFDLINVSQSPNP